MEIKAKKRVDKYGFRYLTYKEGRKTVAEISYPNEYNNYMYRVCYHGFGFDHKCLNEAKKAIEKTLKGVFLGRAILYCE